MYFSPEYKRCQHNQGKQFADHLCECNKCFEDTISWDEVLDSRGEGKITYKCELLWVLRKPHPPYVFAYW